MFIFLVECQFCIWHARCVEMQKKKKRLLFSVLVIKSSSFQNWFSSMIIVCLSVKTGCIMWSSTSSNFNSFPPLITKLGGNAYGHNILAKFDNHSHSSRNTSYGSLWKLRRTEFVCCLTGTVVIQKSPNLDTMLMDIMSQPSLITSLNCSESSGLGSFDFEYLRNSSYPVSIQVRHNA